MVIQYKKNPIRHDRVFFIAFQLELDNDHCG